MYKVYLKISDEAAPSVLEGGMVEISRSQYTRAVPVRTLKTSTDAADSDCQGIGFPHGTGARSHATC